MTFTIFHPSGEDYVALARKEAEEAGFKSLYTVDEVNDTLASDGVTLVLVNSICGCAGGIARPAGKAILEELNKPIQAVTVFAGQQKEATSRARELFSGFAPSSPAFAVLENGAIKGMVERQEIEGFAPEEVVAKLKHLLT
ncbi:BrxA/BrxB family bacilliredoxin [Aureibacillus halotolerans]|uniref:Putative YphP/YqiW family bacilliredoxin n=1 Tax=Aureibacillus halotolerans TaxID=1508390 RepID=A0A4V6PWJ4_9BACI|nr:BrxA/BrxB family bacilliredoxin [Aureibacillus halotolerans]TDQ41627.1 putative YphP/YqiW family bacilliredoxin [Aureibacillus halotolerans]